MGIGLGDLWIDAIRAAVVVVLAVIVVAGLRRLDRQDFGGTNEQNPSQASTTSARGTGQPVSIDE